MQSFYNGLTGMFNFSKSLDNVSNNISNMNTPGFKGNDVFLRSLGDGENNYGSQVAGESVRTQAGDIRQTGNDTDMAITGDGYFVLQNTDGDFFYTRAGQFKFDENNQLVDSATGYSVMAIDENGALKKFDVSENKLLPPATTSEVNFFGNLNVNDTNGHESKITVYDARGEKYDLKATFTKAAAPATNSWDVTIKDSLDSTLTSFQIQFGNDSSPLEASSKITKSLTLNGSSQEIIFNIGSAGSLSATTQLPSSGTESTLSSSTKDGHAALGLRSVSFDENGVIEFKYENGDTKEGQQVALALFADPSSLQLTNSGLSTTKSTSKPTIGKPNEKLFGSVQSKSLEMSNVDLTQEFADILIIQRGYQASSRIMSVANDMLEQLYNNTRSR